MMEIVKGLLSDPLVQGTLLTMGAGILVVVVDYVVKATKNKHDDAIWSKVRGFFVKKSGSA